MGQVTSTAWYLQWYVLGGVAIFLYGLAYAWYLALGATTPADWVKNKLRRRRNARVVLEQEAAREARQAAARAKLVQVQSGPAGPPITIDAKPE